MRIRITGAALFTAATLFAQQRPCGTTEALDNWFGQHPELKSNFERLQKQAELEDAAFVANSVYGQAQSKAASAANYTIPMVFHILHTGGAENISDAQVLDAVNILNRDFRKLNPDTTDIVAPFSSNIGDAKITFSLATKDPNGNCTNGIVRHYDTRTAWDSNDDTYYAYTWPPTRYLNIYVVKTINSNAAGYTFLPGSGIPSSMDAIVILSTYVGATGTGNVFLSRALTHEVGHWFNLAHVWGNTNNPGVACGNDGVSDTPITKGHSNCGTLYNSDDCTPGVPENVQNYMDYSYCSRMFTTGQANRMQTSAGNVVNGRNNLSSASNLFNTGITDPLYTCAPALELKAPTPTVCVGSSVVVLSYTANAAPTAYLWTANNGAVIANSAAANGTISLPNPGSVTITCTASNANGSDTKSVVVYVQTVQNSIASSYGESFESLSIPANWTVLNPTTPPVAWQITSDGSQAGINSIFVNAESSPPNNIEILESPSYNFQNKPDAKFTFYYAYARKTTANKDKFKVQATKDCGGSWTDIWAPSNQLMATESAGTTTVLLTPQPSDWVLYDVTDSPFFEAFRNEPSVRFRFWFQEDPNGSGYGNRLYLDNVRITIPTGINEITEAIGFQVFPNPSEAAFTIRFTLAQPANIGYQVVSATGAQVLHQAAKTYAAGTNEIHFNDNAQLSPGIYFLNFEMNGIKLNKKLVVN